MFACQLDETWCRRVAIRRCHIYRDEGIFCSDCGINVN